MRAGANLGRRPVSARKLHRGSRGQPLQARSGRPRCLPQWDLRGHRPPERSGQLRPVRRELPATGGLRERDVFRCRRGHAQLPDRVSRPDGNLHPRRGLCPVGVRHWRRGPGLLALLPERGPGNLLRPGLHSRGRGQRELRRLRPGVQRRVHRGSVPAAGGPMRRRAQQLALHAAGRRRHRDLLRRGLRRPDPAVPLRRVRRRLSGGRRLPRAAVHFSGERPSGGLQRPRRLPGWHELPGREMHAAVRRRRRRRSVRDGRRHVRTDVLLRRLRRSRLGCAQLRWLWPGMRHGRDLRQWRLRDGCGMPEPQSVRARRRGARSVLRDTVRRPPFRRAELRGLWRRLRGRGELPVGSAVLHRLQDPRRRHRWPLRHGWRLPWKSGVRGQPLPCVGLRRRLAVLRARPERRTQRRPVLWGGLRRHRRSGQLRGLQRRLPSDLHLRRRSVRRRVRRDHRLGLGLLRRQRWHRLPLRNGLPRHPDRLGSALRRHRLRCRERRVGLRLRAQPDRHVLQRALHEFSDRPRQLRRLRGELPIGSLQQRELRLERSFGALQRDLSSRRHLRVRHLRGLDLRARRAPLPRRGWRPRCLLRGRRLRSSDRRPLQLRRLRLRLSLGTDLSGGRLQRFPSLRRGGGGRLLQARRGHQLALLRWKGLRRHIERSGELRRLRQDLSHGQALQRRCLRLAGDRSLAVEASSNVPPKDSMMRRGDAMSLRGLAGCIVAIALGACQGTSVSGNSAVNSAGSSTGSATGGSAAGASGGSTTAVAGTTGTGTSSGGGIGTSTGGTSGGSSTGTGGCGPGLLWVGDQCRPSGCDASPIGAACLLPQGGVGTCSELGCSAVNLQTDPANCGLFGLVCPPPTVCLNGQCFDPAGGPPGCVEDSCAANQTCFPDFGCVLAFCGGLGSEGQACVPLYEDQQPGTCCGDDCARIDEDRDNCGRCGVTCPGGCGSGLCYVAQPVVYATASTTARLAACPMLAPTSAAAGPA